MWMFEQFSVELVLGGQLVASFTAQGDYILPIGSSNSLKVTTSSPSHSFT